MVLGIEPLAQSLDGGDPLGREDAPELRPDDGQAVYPRKALQLRRDGGQGSGSGFEVSVSAPAAVGSGAAAISGVSSDSLRSSSIGSFVHSRQCGNAGRTSF